MDPLKAGLCNKALLSALQGLIQTQDYFYEWHRIGPPSANVWKKRVQNHPPRKSACVSLYTTTDRASIWLILGTLLADQAYLHSRKRHIIQRGNLLDQCRLPGSLTGNMG